MPNVILLVTVSIVIFSGYWFLIGKTQSWKLFALGLVFTGLGGATFAFMGNEDVNSAIIRFVVTDIGYALAYLIVQVIIPSLLNRSREKSKGKPKNDGFFEFDGQKYPIVDEEADRRAGS